MKKSKAKKTFEVRELDGMAVAEVCATDQPTLFREIARLSEKGFIDSITYRYEPTNDKGMCDVAIVVYA